MSGAVETDVSSRPTVQATQVLFGVVTVVVIVVALNAHTCPTLMTLMTLTPV